MNIQTNKFEEFLQINHPDQGMIVFTCRKNLECLCSVTELFMDGTYTFCPKFFKQLYTIHGFQNGHYLPLVFILLSGKSEALYRQCMSSIVQLCTDNDFNLKPDIVHVDFEESMMKVIHSIFPATNIKCCRFHLGQAWWRKIQNLGLANEYKCPQCVI
jgi:hypothetical protein